jgi:hypothetical protein
MYLKVARGMPSEPIELEILVSHIMKLKYPSRVGPIERAMNTLVNKVTASVMAASRPMKPKLRPIIFALFRDGVVEIASIGSTVL